MKVIDLFAGAGGFSEGARSAGAQVVWAANHWPLAVHYHAANHPAAIHVCQDLQQANWSMVPSHDLLLASPACQGHSRARGKERPHHDALRSTAWAVVSCLETHRSPFGIIENVPEFLQWTLYPSWADALSRLGYSIAPHVIDAADHGVPQHRVRMFLVLSRSKSPLNLRLPQYAHRPIGEVIEWDRHRWSPVNKPGRSPRTLARIAAGRAEHGERFVAPFYSNGSGTKGRSIGRPVGAITTVDRWAVIDGDRMRMLQPTEVKAAMGFRSDYALPPTRKEAIHLLGNAVCPPVARDLIQAIREAA